MPVLPTSWSTALSPWARDLAATGQRLLRRHRTPVVIGLCVIAGLSALNAVGSSTVRATQAVVVVVRDVPAGSALTSADVDLRPVPDDVLPSTALRSLDDAIGRRVAVAAAAREVLTPDRLVVPRSVERTGAVLTAVRLADAQVAELLAPGDRVDVLAATSDAAAVVAENVRVAAIPVADTGSGGWLATSSASSDGVVVVEVLPEAAARIAGAAANARLSVALRSSAVAASR